MTWTKLSDDFTDDCWTLSDQAFRLHVEGLCWNNRKLLDCLIPAGEVRRFAKEPDAVAELVTAGWWKEESGGYRIVHHAVYQPSRAEALAAQERSRQNGRKGGRPKGRETQQVSQAGTQPGTPIANPEGRAGTGQASDGRVQLRAVSGDWPTVRCCAICSGPMDPSLQSATHPTCGES